MKSSWKGRSGVADAEVIAPRIEGLAYGDAVTLETSPDQAAWETA